MKNYVHFFFLIIIKLKSIMFIKTTNLTIPTLLPNYLDIANSDSKNSKIKNLKSIKNFDFLYNISKETLAFYLILDYIKFSGNKLELTEINIQTSNSTFCDKYSVINSFSNKQIKQIENFF